MSNAANKNQNEQWNPWEDKSAHIRKFMDIGCDYHLQGMKLQRNVDKIIWFFRYFCQYVL